MATPGAGVADFDFLGFSITIAWVVRTMPATEAALCSAHLATFVGSITPVLSIFSCVCHCIIPVSQSLVRIFSATASPSTPALFAINSAGDITACKKIISYKLHRKYPL
jgi:hypothetical protein